MGQSVQFIGRESVVEAYENRGIEVWGLFERKTFICGGATGDELTEFLSRMEKSGSEAIYTLKVYKFVEDADELTDKMECNGSFNFKLNRSGVGSFDRGNAAIMERLDQLEKKVDAKASDEDDEDGDEPLSINGFINGLLKNPGEIPVLIAAVKSLFGGAVVPVAAPSAVGSITDPSEDEAKKLDAALLILEKHDSRIIDHLCKLADLAEKKPDTFKFLISNLDAL